MAYLTIGGYHYNSAGQESGKWAVGHLYTIVSAKGGVSAEVGKRDDIVDALGSAEAALRKW